MSSIATFNPSSGEIVASFEPSAPTDIDRAVAAAAAVAPALAETAPSQRRRWLDAVADALLAHREELASLAHTETGLGMVRLRGEVERAAGQLRFYGEVAEEGSYLGLTIDTATATAPRLVRIAQPLGVVAVFAASNFPFGFGVLGNDTASALAAGAPVVVKAHSAQLALSHRLAEIAGSALGAAGAPDGTFALISGRQAGIDLVQHPRVAAVGFTGSQSGGLALWRLANDREVVIPVYAEMGTVNPVVMTHGALTRLRDVASGFVGSFTLGSGQFCTKPGLLLAPAGHGVAEAVGQALVDAAPSPIMLTQRIAQSVADDTDRLLGAGASVVTRVRGDGVGWSSDALVLEAPISALGHGSPLREECFGPVAIVVEYSDTTEALKGLAELQGSLAGTVVTDGTGADPEAGAFVSAVAAQVGRVTVDDWPTGVAWSWAQQHGGPWPSTSAPATTSVGAVALQRWVRPVTYQSVPDWCLPEGARLANQWEVPRRVDGRLETVRNGVFDHS